MRKLLPVFLIFAILISQAAIADTGSSVTYTGYTSNHSFSVVIPEDWRVVQGEDDFQGFGPKDVHEDTFLNIVEYEESTYDQVIDLLTYGENHKLVYIDDIIVNANTDLIGKHVVINNVSAEKNYAVTLVKRGNVIISMTEPNLPGIENFPSPDEEQEVISSIYNSFKFTDNWYNYVDYKNNFTLSFPGDLEITTNSSGITLTDVNAKEVFSIIKYEDITLEDAPDYAESFGDDLETTEEISLPGIDTALNATFYNSDNDALYSRIFFEKNGDSYSITNVNLENNYPHADIYDIEILEILRSFEFFTLKEDQSEYKIFFDVADNNMNATAINSLAEQKIISGYPDGSFNPDGKINRAELTKLIVAAVMDEDPSVEDFNNCFPDVKKEWFAPYICYAAEQNWVKGYMDKNFKPGRNINRVESIKIVLEALVGTIEEEQPNKEYKDINPDGWYEKYFAYAYNRDLLDLNHVKDNHFLPGEGITRKEAAEMIFRLLPSGT